jgi:hypothetical protein
MKMDPNESLSSIRLDLSNLRKLSGGNTALELKYITNFINSAPVQLENIKIAVNRSDGKLLYSTLHLLKAQLHFYGIKSAFEETKNTEEKLRSNPEITGAIKKSADFIFKEITLACKEFEALKNNSV